MELYIWPGFTEVLSIDPRSLESISYLQFYKPNEFKIIESTTSNPELPYLKFGNQILSGPSAILHYLNSENKIKNSCDFEALAIFMDSEVLSLVLHSLFSLPKNLQYIRSCLSLPFPANYHRPEALRTSSQRIVDSHHPSWWGLGGESEKNEDAERRRKRDLLGGAEVPDVIKRKESVVEEGKETMKRAFGEGKIAGFASQIFTNLESILQKSTTPYFFNSSSPSAVDIKLSAFLSLILYTPLPQPLLKDIINSNHPRLFSHTALMRRTLFTDSPKVVKLSGFEFSSLSSLLPSLSDYSSIFSDGIYKKTKVVAKETKEEKDFRIKRNYFLGLGLAISTGWALSTGAIPLPSIGGSSKDQGDEYWE